MRVKIKLILLVGDLVVLMLCLAAGTYIRLNEIESLDERYSTAAFLCLLIYPLCLYLSRSYEVQPEASSAENLRRPFLGLLIAITVCSSSFTSHPTFASAAASLPSPTSSWFSRSLGGASGSSSGCAAEAWPSS